MKLFWNGSALEGKNLLLEEQSVFPFLKSWLSLREKQKWKKLTELFLLKVYPPYIFTPFFYLLLHVPLPLFSLPIHMYRNSCCSTSGMGVSAGVVGGGKMFDFCCPCPRHGTIYGSGFSFVHPYVHQYICQYISPSINIWDHPSVEPTVRVRNSETLWDTLANIGTNIKHYQAVWTKQVS